MVDYPVFIFLWSIVLVAIVLNRSKVINAAERVLVDDGQVVFCRDLPLARFFKLKGKAIIKSDVVKVQRGRRCVSLITSSGQAVDLFLPGATVEEVDIRAQALFPNAQHVVVS